MEKFLSFDSSQRIKKESSTVNFRGMCHELGCQVGRNWAAMWAGLKKGLQLL
jgi:hypothetical protein